jgi:hypothetical protein
MLTRVAFHALGLLLSQATPNLPQQVVAPVHHKPAIVFKLTRPLSVPDYKPISTVEPLPVPEPTLPVAAAASYGNTYEWGNCTWYVAGRIHVPETWGNANTWAYYAQLAGYTVSGTPIVGAVAQTSAGFYGHVAIVSAIEDGMVSIDEMNVLGLGVASTRWVPISSFVYIYV